MPTVPPFPAPPRDQLSYLFLGHVSFAFSDGRHIVVVDPYFSGQIHWRRIDNFHLERPTIPVEAVKPIDAILLSHEHQDHADPEGIHGILKSNPKAEVIAPRVTMNDLTERGVDCSRFTQAAVGMKRTFGGMTVTLFPAIESEGQGEPVHRVGFLIEGHGAKVYHQGDSHGPAKAWQAFKGLDSLIIWTAYVDSYVFQMAPKSVIFHHMDQFVPGNFHCNCDRQKELDYWRYRFPTTTFIDPPRNRWWSVKGHG